jgi:hypothetical protein
LRAKTGFRDRKGKNLRQDAASQEAARLSGIELSVDAGAIAVALRSRGLSSRDAAD